MVKNLGHHINKKKKSNLANDNENSKISSTSRCGKSLRKLKSSDPKTLIPNLIT
jgi:hypothetical protein